MPQHDEEILAWARNVGIRLAAAFPPALAKLYSQHTRLNAGQPPIVAWGADEAAKRLEDAVHLIDAAMLRKDAGDAGWTESMLRGAEILEWLCHPTLNEKQLPIALLSAAAYQLAGYPARSAALIAEASEGPITSLLRGDFPSLLQALTKYWTSNARTPFVRPAELPHENIDGYVRMHVERETFSAIGILCATMRWGTEPRLQAALGKLNAVANVMLHGRDHYSWLLAKLCCETAKTFVNTSLRRNLDWLPSQLDATGSEAVERYLRQAYRACKTQAWPSQARGIDRLSQGGSFVLCTPTGSGKTTIAEIAILQSLYPRTSTIAHADAHPLAVYLVPSRALAAEVEAKLQKVIAPLTAEPVIITGLYGGIDWGPTDAWLTASDRTVLICTYEKAEALIRFLGPLFLGRVSLIVLDEAHQIQFNGVMAGLSTGENRQLRLESLISRLLIHTNGHQRKIIGLSAVAAGIEMPLARWLTGSQEALPERTIYRSTRQLIGRLECLSGSSCEIKYDLLDRASLQFANPTAADSPFIRRPFPPHPPAPSFTEGPDKMLRPYLFWAAMHFVAPADSPRRHAVMIYAPQRIEYFMGQLLTLLEQDWSNAQIPVIFEQPVDPARLDKWRRCLAACADYFGTESREYKLLQRGIVAHHGKMPGLMARLLVQLAEEGIVHLIIATSTLSEGVNLPFETVLVPSLYRGSQPIQAAEFANLAGRAGRPGYGTEGRTLVLLRQGSTRFADRRQLTRYRTLIEQLQLTVNPTMQSASSALATLMTSLFNQWSVLATPNTEDAFLAWLDQTTTSGDDQANNPLIESLDALDGVLLAAIVELEALAQQPLSATEIEAKLIQIWQRCYAHYASAEEHRLSSWFLRRGRALGTSIYPDSNDRRRLYRTGLPPKQGTMFSHLYPGIKQHLQTGAPYATWTADQKFQYIKTLVELLGRHPRFAIAPDPRWADKLKWWLDPQSGVGPSNPTTVSTWYNYISQNFTYRSTWGLGLVLSIAADEAHDSVLQPTTLESFPDTELPWIALWLKELLAWGTLDPVAAYLLGRGRGATRGQAQEQADSYYRTQTHDDPNNVLNPTVIRAWADTLAIVALPAAQSPPEQIDIELSRDFSQAAQRQWRVMPAPGNGDLKWIDPAGFLFATGPRPANWSASLLTDGDFMLDVDSKKVYYSPYL